MNNKSAKNKSKLFSTPMKSVFQQVLIWLFIYLVYTFVLNLYSLNPRTHIFNLVQVPIFMLAYYLLKYIQIPYFYKRKKMVQFIISLFISAALLFGIYTLIIIIWYNPGSYKNGKIIFWTKYSFILMTIRFYSPALAILAWESHHNRRKEMQRIKQLEKEKLASELRFLKAQINPHFLFNTLNNLYSYVVTESPKAPDMIVRLTGILDYVLYKSQNKTVPLSEELDTIHNFLGLEQIRYGDRLLVEYQTQGDGNAPISPLILLSLVENAFKHGASGDIDQPKIKIDIRSEHNSIHCKVWNTKSQHLGELNDAYKEGIGLSNIKRQLNLIYPERHELVIEDKEKEFEVNLTLMGRNFSINYI